MAPVSCGVLLGVGPGEELGSCDRVTRPKGTTMGSDVLVRIGARLAEGDISALEDCYRQLGPLVLSYLHRYIPSPEAEDVLRQVFVEVWRHRDRYDPGRPLTSWVWGIARTRAVDHLRARPPGSVGRDVIDELAGDDGRDATERHAWAVDVRRGLDLLPPALSQVLRLAYLGHLTQAEIAAQLAIPLGTVKTRTHQALQLIDLS
ncbi:MAG TPA: sigma-70 family RNA polymerase sigma factor [Mycobacteriales bacterium]|nr:sigma-70 family RNA polymerase sigma factor [Mycobacteriales bacterium]